MFEIQNRIIVVDDTPAHLERLGKEFLNCGLGCRTIEYNALYNTPLKGIRLAFFDIILSNKNIDLNRQKYDYTQDATLSSVFNDLANAINTYIDASNGPYALIFWSSNTVLIDNFVQYVNDRNLTLPKPILVGGINKDEFLYNDEESNGNTIRDRISAILNSTPTNLLFEFEENAQRTVTKTINDIYALIPEDDAWGKNETFNKNFEAVFSKVATSAVGFGHAKQNPDKAILEALAPTIFYDLINLKTDGWKKHLSSISNKNLQYPPNFTVGKLNSIFHIDSVSEVDFTKRGAVFQYNFIPRKSNRFNYFERLRLEANELFGKIIQFNDEKTTSEERDFFRSNSKFIMVEISASCDYSQNKARNQKFILGLLTPTIDSEKINSKIMNESVFYRDIPIIHFKGQNYQIWLNFNFSFSDFDINNNIGEPLFILKKEIMDMIGNRYANHVSRIGITSF